jgi:hypothetical protein
MKCASTTAMPRNKTLLGIALGVAGTLAAPLAAPAVASMARPMIKGLVKHSILGAALLREKLAVALEELDDLLAEVKNEVSDELARKGPSPPRRRGEDGEGGWGEESEGPPSKGNGKLEHPASKPHVRGVAS